MAHNHMYMGQARPEDYNAFNTAAIQATVSSYFTPHARVISPRYDEPVQRDVASFQREPIQIPRNDIQQVLWDGKYVNDGVKYVHVNEAPKYIYLNETPKYSHENFRYVPVDDNVKYDTVIDSTTYTCTNLSGNDISGTVNESVNYAATSGNETSHYSTTKESLNTPKYGEVTQEKPLAAKEAAPKQTHECNVCGKHLSSVGSLKTHMISHSQEKPFVCHICNKRFASSTGHHRHVISHAGVRSNKCNICEKTFVLKSALRQHEKIHEGIKKPYKCEICKCSFRFPFRLKEHQRTHTGERPFVCGVCGKSFRVNRLLAKHKDIHTGKVKKYNVTPKRKLSQRKECPICHLIFADVPQHLKTHDSFKCFRCPFCKKTFKRKPNAQTHIKRQHGLKSSLPDVEEISRDECDSGMEDSLDASPVEKTFQCDTCSRMFALEWSLAMHTTLVHKQSE